MRLVHAVCCAALAAVPMAANANELMKVYEQALTSDPTLQAAVHQHDASVEARPQARALLLPNVAGQYAWNKSKEEGDTSQQFIDDNNQLVSATVPADQNLTGRQLDVTLRQPLFDWQAFQLYGQSEYQVALADATLQSARQNLLLRVAAAYFDVLASADALRSSDAENKAVERQLEQAKKRFEVGLSAITDVQEAQARYDLTVAQQIAARQALESAKEALSVITGQPTTSYSPLQEEIPLPAPDPTSVEAWVGAAATGNLDLLSSRYVADIARKGVNVAWSKHFPTLSFQGSYQKQNFTGDRAGLDIEGDTDTKSYGVVLNIPIFEGLGTQSQVRQAKATREQRQAEYEQAKRVVERTVRDAYQGVISGAARVRALKQAVVSNTTALEASETGLQVGARTAVDVLNAEQLLYAAQRDYYRSRYDYLISVLQLKAAAGRLKSPDLAEVDRLLTSESVATPSPEPSTAPTPQAPPPG